MAELSSVQALFDNQHALSSILGVGARLRPVEVSEPKTPQKHPVLPPTHHERTPSRQGSVLGADSIFTPSIRDTVSPSSLRRRRISHVEIITVRRRPSSGVLQPQLSPMSSVALFTKPPRVRRVLDYISMPPLEPLLQDPEWRTLRKAHLKRRAAKALAQAQAQAQARRADGSRLERGLVVDRKGKGKAIPAYDEDWDEDEEVARSLQPTSRDLASSPTLSKSGGAPRIRLAKKSPKSSNRVRPEVYLKPARAPTADYVSSDYDYPKAGPSKIHHKRSIEWINEYLSEPDFTSDLDAGARESSVSSYEPEVETPKPKLILSTENRTPGRRARKPGPKSKQPPSKSNEWKEADSRRPEKIPKPNHRPLRQMTMFSEEDQAKINKLGATTCHMCHMKRIVMACHRQTPRLSKSKKSFCGAKFCDACLAK